MCACVGVLVCASQDGTCALFSACECGATKAVRMLLAASANPSVARMVCLRVVLSGGVCQDGCTPLLAAVRGSFDTIVSLLLGAGADGNVALLV